MFTIYCRGMSGGRKLQQRIFDDVLKQLGYKVVTIHPEDILRKEDDRNSPTQIQTWIDECRQFFNTLPSQESKKEEGK